MRITIIQGSPREEANSAKVARFFEEQLAQRKSVSSTEFLDIRSFNFPNWGMGEASKEGLALFQTGITEADGLLFVVPEYNGRVPGAFKNTLDYFQSEYAKKPMAIATVSAGPFGGVNALYDFRDWAHYVGGILSQTKLLVSKAGNLFNEQGIPVEEHFSTNYATFLDDFVWLTEKIAK